MLMLDMAKQAFPPKLPAATPRVTAVASAYCLRDRPDVAGFQLIS